MVRYGLHILGSLDPSDFGSEGQRNSTVMIEYQNASLWTCEYYVARWMQHAYLVMLLRSQAVQLLRGMFRLLVMAIEGVEDEKRWPFVRSSSLMVLPSSAFAIVLSGR